MGSSNDHPILRRLGGRNIGCVTLHYTNFGGISLSTTGRLKLGMIHIPTCSPRTITRRTVNVVVALGHHVRHTCRHAHSTGFSLRNLANFAVCNGATNIVNANGVNITVLHVLGNFNVHLLTFSPCPDTTTLRLNIRCISLPALFSRSSIVSLRYPLAPRGCRLLGRTTFSRVGGNIVVIGADHNTLVSSRTTVRTLGGRGVNSLNVSICRGRHSLFFRSGSGSIVRSSMFHHLSTYRGILFAKRRTFLATRTLADVSRAALRGLDGLRGNRAYPGRLIWSYHSPTVRKD